jgi:parallel beta-helix repeat protein
MVFVATEERVFMQGKNVAYWFASFICFILVLGRALPVVDLDGNDFRSTIIVSNPEEVRLPGMTSHAPIRINGDVNFTATVLAEGWPGDGSLEAPYEIIGLEIDIGGAAGYCISIRNTRVNFTIRNCIFRGASVNPGSGIYLNNVSNGKIIENISPNNYYGIKLEISHSNTVINNTFASNSFYGIYLNLSDSNTLVNNTSSSNLRGIVLRATEINTVLWNVFTDNSVESMDSEGKAVFDRNYWSDYYGTDEDQDGFGETPHIFDGNMDFHPLVYLPYPPSWTGDPPDEKTVEWPYIFHFDFDASAPAPILWEVNDTTWFLMNENGVLDSLGSLPIGEYGLMVTVSNIYGISLSVVFRIVVLRDSGNPPDWLTIPTNQVLMFGQKFDYQVTAIDPSGIDRWEVNDTSHFKLQTSFFAEGSTVRIANRSALIPGSYGINLTVFDIYENMLSAIFTVIVELPEQDTTTPTTPQIPEGMDPLAALFVGAGIGAAAVLVIVIILPRRIS